MPFRVLRDKVSPRFIRIVTYLPLITLLFGVVVSLVMGYAFQKWSNRDHEANLTFAAKDYSRRVELLLLNSTLRVQSMFDSFGPSGSRVMGRGAVIREILKQTQFQRVEIIKQQKKLGKDGLPIFKRVFSAQVSADKGSVASEANIESRFIREKIGFMVANGRQNSLTIDHTGNLNNLLLLWRSTTDPKEFALFSASIQSVFSEVPATGSLRALVTDPDTRLQIVLEWPEGKGKVLWDPNDIKRALQNTKSLAVRAEDTSLLSLHLSWLTEKTSPIGPLAWLIAMGGILVFGLISFFLKFIMNQNRIVADMVVKRTIDLESALNEANEASLAKTRFLANVSHELRTPLNIILGMLDLVEEKSQDPKAQEFLKTIKVSGDHLLRLISDLLDVAKESRDEVTVKNVPIKCPLFFEEIGRLVGPECRKKGLGFHLRIAPDLPKFMRGDPARVRQVLMNLLRNSFKYTTRGRIELDVSVLKKPELAGTGPITVRMAVKDTGIGIPETKYKDIFERFIQLESTKILGQGGVGLGLSIVKDLVTRLNGNISVQSTVGEGSVFTVDLDFETMDSPAWISSYSFPSDREIAVVTDDSDFYREVKELVVGERTTTTLLMKHRIGEEKDLGRFSHFIFDSRVTSDLRTLCRMVEERPIAIVGNESELAQLNLPGKVRIVDNSPLLATTLWKVLGARLRVTDALEAKASEDQKTLAVDVPERELSLLIVDDDIGNRHLLEAYFAGYGWNLSFTENGQEALDHCRSHRPDAIIADLRMPVMDGFEMLNRLRAFEAEHKLPEVPVILVTADALEETAEAARKHGATAFLTKPIRKSKIVDAILNATSFE